ncbi:hypothetical protein [Bacteroides fluxus]|jgi:hypothetical protein|uniref:Uncharacterized protein n=1 Tax=Bacteroides fluxus YIT 12057 TaxID=763034 RepID=F3PVA6_9BACE|nr:hypothetical protein [Bacteroides fluxus]EGF55491.1 hypothetical protein HMPREF9446_02688 [Bacteroides fluxus YIT 12057]MDY3788034.1 hypothetical protein [Bacteroides fluxus]
MNKIHIVIKRLANITKYLKQKVFLGKIARIDDTVTAFIPGILLAKTFFLQSWYCKKYHNPFATSSLLSNFARNLNKRHISKVL